MTDVALYQSLLSRQILLQTFKFQKLVVFSCYIEMLIKYQIELKLSNRNLLS